MRRRAANDEEYTVVAEAERVDAGTIPEEDCQQERPAHDVLPRDVNKYYATPEAAAPRRPVRRASILLLIVSPKILVDEIMAVVIAIVNPNNRVLHFARS